MPTHDRRPKGRTGAAQPTDSLDRRHLLLAAVGASAAACAPSSSESGPAVQTGKRVTWRLASSFPRSLDTIYGGAETLAEVVGTLSDGRFRIIPYPAGEIVPGLQVLDAVQAGTVQVGHTASYYYTGKNPALAFDTAMPFGLSARQQSAWLASEGGVLMNELFSDFGMRAFPCGNTGCQMGGWFRGQVESMSDLRGLKMRIPGVGATVMSELGVTVQTIAGGETYQALERGAVDAAEWVGPYDDEKLGFQKIAKNYYYPGWWEPGPGLSALVGQKAWEELPAEYKEIFKVGAAVANQTMQNKYDELNPPALARIREGGVALRRFSDEIMSAAQTASRDLMNADAQSDPGYRKILDAWDRYREESHHWFASAELAYSRFTLGPFTGT